MVTPEQKAFIQEMQRTKPKEVWQELWDARQRLKKFEAVGTSVPVELEGWSKLSKFVEEHPLLGDDYTVGLWTNLPFESAGPPLEYMRDDLGITHIRPFRKDR